MDKVCYYVNGWQIKRRKTKSFDYMCYMWHLWQEEANVCKTCSTFNINRFQNFHYRTHISTDKRGWCALQSTGYAAHRVRTTQRVFSCSPIHQGPLATRIEKQYQSKQQHFYKDLLSIHKMYRHFGWSFQGRALV